MTVKIAFTTEAVTWRPRSSVEPLTASPSMDAIMQMATAMNGALMIPARKLCRLIAACSLVRKA